MEVMVVCVYVMYNLKNREVITFPKLPSAIRPTLHNNEITVPQLP